MKIGGLRTLVVLPSSAADIRSASMHRNKGNVSCLSGS